MYSKDNLKDLITKGEWKKVKSILLEKFHDFGDANLINQIYLISSRYEDLSHRDTKGILSTEEKTRERNKIDDTFFNVIDEVFDILKKEDFSLKITPDELNTLKNALLPYFLEQNGIRLTIQLLKNLLDSSSPKLAESKKIESELLQSDSKYSFTVTENQSLNNKNKFEEWCAIRDKAKVNIKFIIDHLEVDDITQNGDWESIYLKTLGLGSTENSTANDIFGLFTPADKITEPANLSDDKKHLFRRLLHRSQDALAVKNYYVAYQCCERIRDNVEPNSAQLYEYMLLIFAKKEGISKIIKEALEENQDNLVRHLILYAGRYFQFQKEGSCVSLTGEDNIQEIINGLSNSLRVEYSSINYDYIITDQINTLEREQRIKIKKAINVAFDIFYAIPEAPPMSFLNVAYNELSGGGKFDWIEILDITDNGWTLMDKKQKTYDIQLDALTVIKEIEAIFKDKYKGKSINTIYILSQNLLSSLNRRYDDLKNYIRENPYTSFPDKSKLVNILIKLINTYKIGYEIFNKNKEFLSIPIEELQGGGIFKWAIFDSNGDLRENELCKIHNFPAMEELAHMVKLKEGDKAWRSIRTVVREETYKRLAKETDESYENLAILSKVKNIDDQDRKKVIKCLDQWEILYFLKYDEKILEKYLNELTGSGIFLWLDVDANGIISNEVAQRLYFRSDLKLNRILTRSSQQKISIIKEKIANNLLNKDLLKEYNIARKNDEQERSNILRLLERAKNAYKFVFPESNFLKFVHGELIQENKLKWFDIENDQIVHSESVAPNNSQLSNLYDDFLHLAANSGLFTQKQLTHQIVSTRYRETERAYLYDIREFKSQNGIREMETAIKIIRKCYAYYKVYPDKSFLKIPKLEFIERDGRIRWSYKIGRCEFPTFAAFVGGIYDVYRKEKRKLQVFLNPVELPDDEVFSLELFNLSPKVDETNEHKV